MNQRLTAAAALVVLALALALSACGGGGESDNGVARLGNGSAKKGAAAGASQDPDEAMLAYTECMRKNGVDMPDPQSGGFVITPETQDNSRQGRGKFEKADKNCRSHLKNLRPPKLSEEEEAEMREAALEHARCMREHGVDIPDPEFGEGGQAAIPLDGLNPNDPDFQAAQKACEETLRGFEPGAGGSGAGR